MTPTQAPDQGAAMPGSAGPPHPYDRRWYLHVDGKTGGPYTGHQIRLMAEQHQIVASDLVYAEGGTAWRQIADDPILGVLFKSAEPRRTPVVPRLESRGFGKWLFVIPVLVIAGWIGWPYYTLYKLTSAFRAGDVLGLDENVDWENLRQGIRSDLNAAILQLINADAAKGDDAPAGALGTGLAALLAPTVINQFVEGYITPQAIAAQKQANALTKNGPTDGRKEVAGIIQSVGNGDWDQVEYMFFSSDPFTFKVQVRPHHDPPLKSFTLILKWSGRWKLTRIFLPVGAFGPIVDASTQNLGAPQATGVAPTTMITPAVATKNDDAASKKKQDYFQNLQIYDFKAHYYSSLGEGRIPGVEFKIKNNGAETLDKVKVTVYFKDAKGNTVAEEDYFPVLVTKTFSLSNDKPLKPNYIWQMERGKFYTAKSVPSEWKEGEAEIRITDLEFGKGDSKSAEEQKLPSTSAKRVPPPTQISDAAKDPPKQQDAPTLGAAIGAQNARLSQSEMDALRARISSCWSPPPGVDAHSRVYVVLRVLFKTDGSMVQAPTLVEGSASALGPALAESAKRALLLCQPFTMLKPEHYDQWKDLELRFDPHELLGG
jgi:hypothetical protein